MSLLDSLKFCVIEHQPAWLMIFCLVFYKSSLYSISFVVIGYYMYVEKNSAFFVCSGEAEHRLVEVFYLSGRQLFCWCSRTVSCKFEWQWYIGKAHIGRLVSLLDSLKFCVIEHQTQDSISVHRTCKIKNILAKSSAGDVVAQELKYHGACLTSLHNKERAHLRMKQ
jgi:hypothetical protein